MNDSLFKAIQYFGSQAKLAKALGVTPMAISQWKKRGVTLDAAKNIEEKTNGFVTRYQLRPDYFGH